MADLSRRLKPIHDRHLQVQDHYIGVEFFNSFNRNLTDLSLTAYFPTAVFLDSYT